MVEAQLELGLRPVVGNLPHKTELNFQIPLYRIAQSPIGSVSVEELNGPAVTDVALAIDEQFVVEGNIKRLLIDDFAVQRNVDEQIVPVARSEVLVFHPTLLVPESVPEVKDASDLLREQGFLVDPAFGGEDVR